MTLLLVVGLGLFYFQYIAQRQKMLNRLSVEAKTETDAQDAGTAAPQGRVALRDFFLNMTRKTGERFKPGKPEEISRIENKFTQAGMRNKTGMAIYWGVKFLLMLALPAGFLTARVILWHKPIAPLTLIMILIVLALLGSYLPEIWLRMKISSRQQTIIEGFPDALDLMVICVEAGMSLDSAIYRVGEEMKLSNPILSEELKLTNMEMRAGKSRRDALRSLAARTGVADIESLVSLLIQTDRFGTSIADSLRAHSEFMRVTRYQRAEELAMKIPVKILFPMLFCVFPVIMIIIMGPPFIQAYRLWIASH